MQKRLFNYLLVLLLGVTLFSSCKDDGIDSMFFRTDGTLNVVLTDTDGSPISGVQIYLYHRNSESIITAKNTDDNGVVDFGRYESGIYQVNAKFTHNSNFYDVTEEVHINSGVTTSHEMNVADFNGDISIKILDSNSGEVVETDMGIKLGFIPVNEDFFGIISQQEMLNLIINPINITNGKINVELPVAEYYIVLHNDTEILEGNYHFVNQYQKTYTNFYINPINFLLASKSTWGVSSVTTSSGLQGSSIFPVSSLEFNQGNLLFNLTDGTTYEGSYTLYSDQGFYMANVYANNITMYFNESYYEINADGSITFYFNYVDTYNSGSNYYDSDVRITIN